MLHIDLPTHADIDALVAHRAAPAVSIYVSTTPLTQDAAHDRIELKNLLKAAVAEMEAGDTPKRSIWPIEQAVEAILEDDDFWMHQANSLAIFATPERIRTFRLPNKLTSMVEVSDRFHLKPLIRSVTFPHNAYVLAIGMGSVRLVEVDADLPPQVVKVPDLPKDMASALGRRSHAASTAEGRSGEITSDHALASRYARIVDQALRPVIGGDRRPLIIAATEPMASVYRSVSSHPNTADHVIAGAADQVSEHDLAVAARGILDRIYADDIAAIAGLYATREGQGRATTDVANAARAATFGAVDTLIVDMDAVVTGTVDDDGNVTFTEGADAATYGVVDEIAQRTLLAGGRVVSARRADVPGGGDLAAILRYPA